MEFDQRNSYPESLEHYLMCQVEEQSDVCDITVKMGPWKRKYHRCVLMISPFFESVLRNNFIEKTTGTITLHRGSSSSINMSLMFLYGKQPDLNVDNIEDMVAMAEFFQIPNLKADCYRWLEQQEATEETCLSWIQMASTYGFELENSIEYVESHLVEILQQHSAFALTFESIRHIFSDLRLNYLPMDERIRFLVRWYLAYTCERQYQTELLLELISFNDISESCMHELKSNPLVESLLHDVGRNTSDELTYVMISISNKTLYCYDLSRDAWFHIQKDDTNGALFSGEIADTTPDYSGVYIKDGMSVNEFNLDTSHVKTYQVFNIDNPSRTTLGFQFKSYLSCYRRFDRAYIKTSTQAMQSNESGSGKSTNSSQRRKLVMVVYIGKMVGDEIRMRPMFSSRFINFDHVSSLTSNTDSVIAFTSGSCVVLYDTINCTMDTLKYRTSHKDKIFPDQNGFVIHNHMRCITIQRKSDPTFPDRYELKEFLFGKLACVKQRYYYCNGTWFRFWRANYRSNFHFQCVERSKLEEAQLPEDVEWKDLSAPTNLSDLSNSLINDTCTTEFLRLQRRLLRCHIDCPHCKIKTQQSADELMDEWDEFMLT